MMQTPHEIPVATNAKGPTADTDLFTLGRAAAANARTTNGGQAVFARSRQLLATRAWRGPRDAAESFIEEGDLAAQGFASPAGETDGGFFDPATGFVAAFKAGVGTLLALSTTHLPAARAAGLRCLLRIPFEAGAPDTELLTRLETLGAFHSSDSLHSPDSLIDGLVPTPVGEPLGLDTLRAIALCRLHGRVRHVVLDVARLGPRLAQMGLGFGADELYGPIVAERALRLGDNANNPALTRKEAALIIRGAGLVPFERLSGGALEEFSS